MLPLLVLLGTIAGAWYLLIVRPQKEQQTRHGRLVERLQVGDHVLTVGGIYGRVVAVEGSSVVLELAPGLTTRIATDGIARIVHGGEAALPTIETPGAQVAPETPHTALDTDMQHHPHPDHQHAPQQQFAAPTYVAPQQPYAAHPPVAAPAQPVAHQVQPPVQLPAPPAPAGQATMRAHVVGASIPTFEPRPWSDVAPVNAPATHPQAAPHHPQQYAAMPQQHAMPQHAMPQHAMPQHAMPAAIPVHAPFAPAVAPAPQQWVPAPATHAPAGHASPAAPVPAHQAMHQHQPAATHAHPVPDTQAVPQPQVEEPTRRHSRAPQGMGSTLRLDDPSLRDTMARAREERTGLAGEYRKLTAPLVDAGATQQPATAAVADVPADAVIVGHDPNGVPLFATPGSPVAHPVAPQYPAPARVEGVAAMPRPVVQAPAGAVDPALTSRAFQRRAPYAPVDAGQVPQQHAAAPAAAHAGMS